MTREEEIKRAALDCHSYDTFIAFVRGARWADENPDKNLVYTKQELMDMGFGFDLNGNIITPQEIGVNFPK